MEIKQLIKTFENPGREYRGKPFWSWNGELEKDELRRQVGVMKEMGLGGYFMHSRAGLITEYLGKDWFELINATADAGEAAGMEAWLYDEDRWPSGSAGGKVTVDEQYRMKSLTIYERPLEGYVYGGDCMFVFAAKLSGIDIYDYVKLKKNDIIAEVIGEREKYVSASPGNWKILEFRIVPDKPNSNYNGTTYIDTMSRAAVDRFIELTHEQYREKCGDRLGRSIKGIFTDEPHRGHCMDNRTEKDGVITCQMAWTDDLFDEFKKRYGYDARAVLPELFYRPNAKKVSKIKLHYIDLADNLFLERFAMPINNWCEKNGIVFTGHVLHEDALTCQTAPHGSLMRFYQYMGAPGVDVLSEGNRCYWIVKQLNSAARQLGKKWQLSELYGCTGWRMNLRSHKAVGDWQALLGINLRCQHLSWYTMEGESKRDYPASILHQSPWYHDYNLVETYFARFGAIISEGDARCDVLVINPIESVWCQAYIGWSNWISNASPDVAVIEQRYTDTFKYLTQNHIDFDYGEEQMMAPMTAIARDSSGHTVMRVGKISYRVVVVTGMLTMRATTLELLRKFISAGGKVIFAGELPSYIDAKPSDDIKDVARHATLISFGEESLVSAVRSASSCYIDVLKDDVPAASIMTRVIDYPDGNTAVALLNTDREHASGKLRIQIQNQRPASIEEWDMLTGLRYDANSFARSSNGVSVIETSLEAAGTRVFMLSRERDASCPARRVYTDTAEYEISGRFDYSLDEPDVCVLDFARWRWTDDAHDNRWHDEREVLKTDQSVRDDIGIERRGGEMLQPWYAKLHDTKKYGEIELEYEFYSEKDVDDELYLAGERPEYNTYSINGVKLECPDRSDFWIDNAFKKMPIPKNTVKAGRNIVTIRVTFMRTTNIEAVYLIGKFGVKLDGHKKTLTNVPEKLGFGNLIDYDLPFYTGAVTYTITAENYAGVTFDKGERIMLRADSFVGSLVRVYDGDTVTKLAWEPYEADVTDAVKAGRNIYVTLVGTRRDTFGPLHLVPLYHGAYGPGHFVTEGGSWTNDYNLIDNKLGSLKLVKVK